MAKKSGQAIGSPRQGKFMPARVETSRWRLAMIIAALMVTLLGCGEEMTSSSPQTTPANEGTIVALGDSLTEGLGVEEEAAYPAMLEKKLRAQGYRYEVINAGVSGESSSGTLTRIKWVLTLKPDIVILVIGANDGLRGIDPALIKENIRQIIRLLKENKVIVVLGGMQIVQNLGKDYTTAFAGVYPELAREENVIFIPFFLAAVAADASLNQADGIHPTAEGYRVIVDNLLAYVIEAVQAHRANVPSPMPPRLDTDDGGT
jgi:acyl-CoA thioesterase I